MNIWNNIQLFKKIIRLQKLFKMMLYFLNDIFKDIQNLNFTFKKILRLKII